ncbi:MAG TPA: hypothetical protein DCL77_09875 [Prolixibacteraceae bacterium]|jgi:hypothetical protein|nr:hypothetical protein [Prolixibacteraceae bacterium]
MTSTSLLSLTSIAQMGLFLGIASILFGWVEKKDKIVLAGQLAFLLLGILTLWILLTDQIALPDTPGIITKQVKVFAFFKGLAWFSLFNVVSLLLKFFKLRLHQYSLYLLLLFALMLFFMVYSIQQLPG